MNISISREAQEMLKGIITNTSFERPTVRIFYAGIG